MNLTKYLTILLITVLFANCKKDEITGDYIPLIGKWQWVITIDNSTGQTTSPATANERVLEITKKGRYCIFNNYHKQSKGAIWYKEDYIEFHTWGLEKANDYLTFKKFRPNNIRNDSLFLAETKVIAGVSVEYVDIYVRNN